jgi:hypothetical protein
MRTGLLNIGLELTASFLDFRWTRHGGLDGKCVNLSKKICSECTQRRGGLLHRHSRDNMRNSLIDLDLIVLCQLST